MVSSATEVLAGAICHINRGFSVDMTATSITGGVFHVGIQSGTFVSLSIDDRTVDGGILDGLRAKFLGRESGLFEGGALAAAS